MISSLIIKFSVLAAVLILAPASVHAAQAPAAQAQTGVTGEVVDQTGQRVAGAFVLLEQAGGTRLETTSDARGEFRFDGIAPGSHVVTATAVGFAPASAPVALERGRTGR